ncbi:MAG: efflux RND transporter periplasmic adaptor subunit [Terriglobia bacterium]
MQNPGVLGKRSVRLAVLAAGCIAIVGCSNKPRAASDEAAAVVAEVTVTRVERADISTTLAVSGIVAALPNQDVRVSSLVPGRVEQMMVAEGDHVRSGAVLAKIDDRLLRDQARQAESAVEQARANLENARLNLDRNERLFQRGIAARKELEDARTQVSVDEAAMHQAEAAAALARLQVARAEVRSPLDGLVVKRWVSVGEQVDGTAAQPLFEVANLAEVELFGSVPAVYLQKIRIGQRLRISTDALPGKEFTARVVAISPAVDPATNVGLVRIRTANRADLLRLGMYLAAQLPLETHAQALVVPPQAVYRNQEGNPVVYRVRGEDAEAIPVRIGLETQARTELLGGVEAGDTIILTNGYGLGQHSKVKVRQ